MKNNLQTVSALLRLQSRRIEDEGARVALEEAVRRIASIALVHETLSTSLEETVGFDEVLDHLVTNAMELSPRMSEIEIRRIGVVGTLEPRVATPLALVVTELIHNALEHGLARKGNLLSIEIIRDDALCSIAIADDGEGLPLEFEVSASANLGLQIVRTLTENELQGKLSLEQRNPGTRASLTFPL